MRTGKATVLEPLVMMIDRSPMEPLRGYLLEHLPPYKRRALLRHLNERAARNRYRLDREIPMKGWAIGNKLTARPCEGARPVWYWQAYPVRRVALGLAP